VTDEQPICPKCGKTPHPKCRDGFIFPRDPETGNVIINPETGGPYVQSCPRILLKKVLARLGPELASVKTIRGGGPLFSPKAKVDLRGINVFITGCTWPWLRPHIRYALARSLAHDLNYDYKIITDQQIKAVFVGDESYKARPKETRDERPTYNSLGDLVGPSELVILRLGHLGHKNRAAAGAIKEALRIREEPGKPTWLVDEADHPWEQSHSYDPDLEDYISTHFKKVRIKGVDPGYDEDEEIRAALDADMGDEDEDDFDTASAVEQPTEDEEKEDEDDEDEADPSDFNPSDFDLPGKKPKWRRS